MSTKTAKNLSINTSAVLDRAFEIIENASNTNFLFPINITVNNLSAFTPTIDTVNVTATVFDQNNNPLPGVKVRFSSNNESFIAFTNELGVATYELNQKIKNQAVFFIADVFDERFSTLLISNGSLQYQRIGTISSIPYAIADSLSVGQIDDVVEENPNNSSIPSENNSTVVPENNSSEVPEDNSTVVPENNSSVLPEDNSTVVPENNSSVLPTNNSTPIITNQSNNEINQTVVNANEDDLSKIAYYETGLPLNILLVSLLSLLAISLNYRRK